MSTKSTVLYFRYRKISQGGAITLDRTSKVSYMSNTDVAIDKDIKDAAKVLIYPTQLKVKDISELITGTRNLEITGVVIQVRHHSCFRIRNLTKIKQSLFQVEHTSGKI